jgi:hypothetical protein
MPDVEVNSHEEAEVRNHYSPQNYPSMDMILFFKRRKKKLLPSASSPAELSKQETELEARTAKGGPRGERGDFDREANGDKDSMFRNRGLVMIRSLERGK